MVPPGVLIPAEGGEVVDLSDADDSSTSTSIRFTPLPPPRYPSASFPPFELADFGILHPSDSSDPSSSLTWAFHQVEGRSNPINCPIDFVSLVRASNHRRFLDTREIDFVIYFLRRRVDASRSPFICLTGFHLKLEDYLPPPLPAYLEQYINYLSNFTDSDFINAAARVRVGGPRDPFAHSLLLVPRCVGKRYSLLVVHNPGARSPPSSCSSLEVVEFFQSLVLLHFDSHEKDGTGDRSALQHLRVYLFLSWLSLLSVSELSSLDPTLFPRDFGRLFGFKALRSAPKMPRADGSSCGAHLLYVTSMICLPSSPTPTFPPSLPSPLVFPARSTLTFPRRVQESEIACFRDGIRHLLARSRALYYPRLSFDEATGAACALPRPLLCFDEAGAAGASPPSLPEPVSTVLVVPPVAQGDEASGEENTGEMELEAMELEAVVPRTAWIAMQACVVRIDMCSPCSF